ncbi:MAG: 50S ribosomal protein L28 [Holosporales bacterium]|jgi:large subunit ribosomal protein L28|nr:50S ribosomal protein L28 [Holosporales bacterium]
MARVCSVTGKRVMSGNNVSHANNRTRRRFLPNLQRVSFKSEALGCRVPLRLSARAMRTIEKNGGLDAFLSTASSRGMSPDLLRVRRAILNKISSEK